MDILKTITSKSYRRGRRILTRLHRSLADEYQKFLQVLAMKAEQPEAVASLVPILPEFSRWRHEAGQLLTIFETTHLSGIQERVSGLNREILHRLQETAEQDHGRRRWLMRTMQHTVRAEHEFDLLAHDTLPDHNAEHPVQVILPTDMLYQCRQNLFPAERMMVVAGRRRNHRIVLGAAFDVTGAASAGHVRADPHKLAQALIAMSSTSSHLAGWFHSHPGEGADSTMPSETDRRQHADWLKDYSPDLLSGIFVRDGVLRLWGTSLERGTIRPVLAGTGVSMSEGEENVYSIHPA